MPSFSTEPGAGSAPRARIRQRAQPRIRNPRASAAGAARRPRRGGRHARVHRRHRRAARHAHRPISTTSWPASCSTGGDEAQPTTGFQRVIHRAVVHVQSSGREEVTGANVLVAIFAERESHAAFFLQEQEMTRFDAVQYISHGIAKRPGMSEPRDVRGVDEDAATARAARRRSAARTRSTPIASTSTRRRATAASIR